MPRSCASFRWSAPGGITRLPLFIVFGYLVATFALFLIWPINWPIYYLSDWLRLIGYVGLCFAVIAIATIGARRRSAGHGAASAI